MEDTNDKCGCCKCYFPTLPPKWLKFLEFAFTFGTTVVLFADIVTDIITLEMYYRENWHIPFALSIAFIIIPSIFMAFQEFNFLRKTHGKQVSCGMVALRTLLNIPFQLTVIWYHIKLSSSYFRVWLDDVKGIQRQQNTSNPNLQRREMSVSSLADIDERHHTIERKSLEMLNVPVSPANPDMQRNRYSIAPAAGEGENWWKRLTREQWLSHLNKLKLSESMLESLPQLMINLYLILRYPEKVAVVQYISAVVSYLSLCGGVVRFDKTRKDNEAERWMVDRTLLHSRSFHTRLEWPQMIFLSLYKGSFLAARILAIVYFTITFQLFVLVAILLHWIVYLAYLVWRWYPTNMNKTIRRLDQVDYKYRAYMFLSHDFTSIFESSLIGIFIYFRAFDNMFYGRSYCFIFWYYFIYITENVVLFIIPGLVYTINGNELELMRYEYYAILIVELLLNLFGAILCVVYYFIIHKMHVYTQNAYSNATKLFNACFCQKCANFTSVYEGWTVCKQAETSEIFYLRKTDLDDFKKDYTTIARSDRRIGRTLEMFVDDRGSLFYAPRDKLFKKIVDDDDGVELDTFIPSNPDTVVTREPLNAPMSDTMSSTNANVGITDQTVSKVPGVAFSVSLTQSIHDPDSDPEVSLDNIVEEDEDAFMKDVNSKPSKFQKLLNKTPFKSSKDTLTDQSDRSAPCGQVPTNLSHQPVNSMWV